MNSKDWVPSPVFPNLSNRSLWEMAISKQPEHLPVPAPINGKLSLDQQKNLSQELNKASIGAGSYWNGKCLQASMEMAWKLNSIGCGEAYVILGNLWQNQKPLFACIPDHLRAVIQLTDLYQSHINGYYHCWIVLADGTLIDPSLNFTLSNYFNKSNSLPILTGHIEMSVISLGSLKLTYEPIQIHTLESALQYLHGG